MEPQVCVSCLREEVQLYPYVRSKDSTEISKVFKILLKYFNTNMESHHLVTELEISSQDDNLTTLCAPCFSFGEKLIILNDDLEKIQAKIQYLLDDYSSQISQCHNGQEVQLQDLFEENISPYVDNLLAQPENIYTETELVEIKEELDMNDTGWDAVENISINSGENLATIFDDSHSIDYLLPQPDIKDIANTSKCVHIPLKKLSVSLERLDWSSVRIRKTSTDRIGKGRPRKSAVSHKINNISGSEKSSNFKRKVGRPNNSTYNHAISNISVKPRKRFKGQYRQPVLLIHETDKKPKLEPVSDDENISKNKDGEDSANSMDEYKPPKKLKTKSSRKGNLKCKTCCLTFATKELLSTHMNSPVHCKVCDKTYFSHSTYTHHVKSRHSAKFVKCTKCNEKFKNQFELELHQMSYTGEIPYECHCCHEKFSNVTIYMLHQRQSQCPISPGTAAPSFPCEVCGKTFKAKFLLYAHQSAEHDKPSNGFNCNICAKNVKNSEELYIHYISHTSEYAYTCDICGKPTRSPLNLYDHRQSHVGMNNISCKLCDLKFNHKTALSRHIEMSHNSSGQVMMCHVCSMEFKVKQDFTRHVATHFKNIICDICGKAFNRNVDLKTHLRIHTGDMFPCTVCDKKFVSTYLRNQHMARHLNIPKNKDRVVKPRAKRKSQKLEVLEAEIGNLLQSNTLS